MAKTNAILTEDRSAAGPVALVVLCALAVGQGLMLLASVWSDLRSGAPAVALTKVENTNDPTLAPLPVLPLPLPQTGPSAPPAVSPGPAHVVTTGHLPPPPSMSGGGLPPLPTLPSTLRPVPSLSPSPSAAGQIPAIPRPFPSLPPVTAASPPVSAPAPALVIPKTGKPQVDELIEVAVQSRELNDADGAMQALERADLILPDNPVILREKALTYGKLGRADKAQEMWDRISKLGPGAGTASAFPTPSASMPPPPADAPGSLNSAFASLGAGGAGNVAGPLSLGPCQVVRDATVMKGQKFLLKIPVKSQPGTQVAVTDWNLDVLFYDRVDDVRLEPTNADPVTMTFDMPVNFQSSEEVVTAVYHMPELTSQEMANIGHREFGGYVVKLYYQNRLMSTAAAPRELLGGTSGQGAGSAPVANPLLPPLPK